MGTPRSNGDRRGRLLYLGHNLPFPPHEGALIRSYHTLRILSEEYDVSALLFFRRSAHPTEEIRNNAIESLSRKAEVVAFAIEQEFSRPRFVWDHVRSLFTGSPYTQWMHESRAARRLLRDWISHDSFDLIHVDSIDLVAYLPHLPRLPTVLAHHNIESNLLSRRAEVERGLQRRYIHHQSRLVERAERRWCPLVDLNVVVSSDDAEQLERLVPEARMLVVPNGVDTNELRPSTVEPRGGLLFVGGHSWFPNADAMEYFATEILPLIRERLPNVAVRWIGKATEDVIRRFRSLGIEMLGYVPDIRPYAEEARCVIVPLRIGGGTRLKILDAWALGKAVVSTSVGCEGLDARHRHNILVADSARDFGAAVVEVMGDEALRRSLEKAGRATAVQTYDWERLGGVMVQNYRELVDSAFARRD